MTKDMLIGFAVGDAYGVPYEFLSRKEIGPILSDEMLGNDTPMNFKSRWSDYIPKGAWSDDTSMLVATMAAICDSKGKLNYTKIMDNFVDWMYHAKYTSINQTFGIGNIVYNSVSRYMDGESALKCGGTGIRDNGNGSLMRILPISLYCIYNGLDDDAICEVVSKGSSLTHAHEISKMSCVIYTFFLQKILEKRDKYEAFDYAISKDYSVWFSEETIRNFNKLLNDSFKEIDAKDIRESGYVLDTLEATIYSILKNNNYKDTIQCAVKLGYDTDTVAGITGSIAGAMYGMDSIPENWIKDLKKKKYLENMAELFDYNILFGKDYERENTIRR